MLKFLRMEFNEVCGKACGENASTVVDEATSPRMLGRVALSTTSKGTFSSAGRPTPGESIRQCSTQTYNRRSSCWLLFCCTDAIMNQRQCPRRHWRRNLQRPKCELISNSITTALSRPGPILNQMPTNGGTGEPAHVDTLTNSGAQIQFCVSRVYSPGGRMIEGSGTLPDVRVERDRESTIQRQDLAMEAAIRILQD